jgi:hypothetical protein
MAGIKGKSGRKRNAEVFDKEIDCKELWGLSADILIKALKDPNITKRNKINIALTLVSKMLPTEFKNTGKNELTSEKREEIIASITGAVRAGLI